MFHDKTLTKKQKHESGPGMKKTKCVPDTFQQIQSVDLKSDQQFVLLPPLYYTFFLLGDTVACYNEHGTVYVSINAHKCTEEYAAL